LHRNQNIANLVLRSRKHFKHALSKK